MSDIQSLIDFTQFTHLIRNVRRRMELEEGHFENDAEHSYQTALIAWFIIEKDKLPLDKFRCIGMAMVHDIVEAYAGDISTFSPPNVKAAQIEKEKEAIKQLRADWPQIPSLHDLIEEYEDLKSDESKFVFALDKLVPVINGYLYQGRAWKAQGVTPEIERAVKFGKVDKDPVIAKYYQAIQARLEKNPERYFAV